VEKDLIYPISIKINGRNFQIEVKAHHTLLTVLREQLDFTGPKEGCGVGECGACTVLLDGKPVNSCMILAVEVNGQEIITIEGLGGPEALDNVQQAFIDHGAVQCGFCTPGMIMSAKYLLDTNPNPSEEEIKIALAGNLCRCTGYTKIIEAVKSAAQMNQN